MFVPGFLEAQYLVGVDVLVELADVVVAEWYRVLFVEEFGDVRWEGGLLFADDRVFFELYFLKFAKVAAVVGVKLDLV